jgi:hypothetical protein
MIATVSRLFSQQLSLTGALGNRVVISVTAIALMPGLPEALWPGQAVANGLMECEGPTCDV